MFMAHLNVHDLMPFKKACGAGVISSAVVYAKPAQLLGQATGPLSCCVSNVPLLHVYLLAVCSLSLASYAASAFLVCTLLCLSGSM